MGFLGSGLSCSSKGSVLLALHFSGEHAHDVVHAAGQHPHRESLAMSYGEMEKALGRGKETNAGYDPKTARLIRGEYLAKNQV